MDEGIFLSKLTSENLKDCIILSIPIVMYGLHHIWGVFWQRTKSSLGFVNVLTLVRLRYHTLHSQSFVAELL